jgi:hypothetical protein
VRGRPAAVLALISTVNTFGLLLALSYPAAAIEATQRVGGFSEQQKPRPGKGNTQEVTEEEGETTEEVSEVPKPPTRRTAKLLEKGIAGLATRLKVEPEEDGSVDGKKIGAKAACLAAKSLSRGGKGVKC